MSDVERSCDNFVEQNDLNDTLNELEEMLD
jgi:hypothetical protein